MDPTTLIALGVGGLALCAAIGAGVSHALLARKQAFFEVTQRALEGQRFTVERIEQRHMSNRQTEIVLTAALVARDGRAHVHLSPTVRGAAATIVVRGVRAAAHATFSVGRASLFARAATRVGVIDIEVGDPLFDQRYRVGGWPKDQARAFLGAERVKNAVEAMFGFDDVRDVALVGFQDDGGVRVTLSLDQGRVGAVRPVADLALACALALDDVRFAEPAPRPSSSRPQGAAGVEGGAPVGVPGLPPER